MGLTDECIGDFIMLTELMHCCVRRKKAGANKEAEAAPAAAPSGKAPKVSKAVAAMRVSFTFFPNLYMLEADHFARVVGGYGCATGR